jgi:hypothetical protein
MQETNETKEEAPEVRKLGITSLYVNTHRVLESIGIKSLPPGFIDSLNRIADHPLQKGFLVSMLSPVLVEWVKREKIPSLEELLIRGTLQTGSVFTYDGKFASRGLAVEKPGDATLRLSLKEFGDSRVVVINFHADNLTTASAHGSLQGQPSVFVIAAVNCIENGEISCRPYVIGNLVQIYGKDELELRYRDYLQMRPEEFDSFKPVDFTQRMTASDLDILKTVPEETVKKAFAAILGEPDVSKDWGGEECDLFGSNVLIDGQRVNVAFAFKGPSKFKPMECSDCGKNGDQIVRLFGSGAEVFVLQHCHTIRPAVKKTMAAFARAHLSVHRRFCIIDGYDTIKILRHFGYLK